MSASRQQALYRELASRAVPFDVLLELHRRCTFACRHCYVPATADDGLPLDRLVTLLDELADAGTLRLTLTGGEPLIHPHWQAVAEAARRRGFAVQVLTNGAAVDRRVAATLAGLHAKVHVSVYAADRAAFGRITGRPDALQLVVAGLRQLRDHGVDTAIAVPVLAASLDQLPAIAALADELGMPCQVSPAITPRRDGGRQPLAHRLDDDQLRRFLAGPFAAVPGDERCPVGPLPDDEPLCAAGTRLAVVTPTGDVLACPDLPRAAGNVLEQPFASIWSSSPWLHTLRRLRRTDLPACSSCPSATVCGRCQALALVEDGDLLGPSTWACTVARAVEDVRAGRP